MQEKGSRTDGNKGEMQVGKFPRAFVPPIKVVAPANCEIVSLHQRTVLFRTRARGFVHSSAPTCSKETYT